MEVDDGGTEGMCVAVVTGTATGRESSRELPSNFSDHRPPAKRSRPRVPQPHLTANMERYRQLIGVPHRYWNRAMPRQAQWSVIIIDVLPPDRGQLRIRLVVEARQTARDGSGKGTVIGPSIRLTPLLVELEKRTKAANPPRYYRDRPETTRKACDQLTVDGRRSVWFLKKFLQGQDLLPFDILPQPLQDFVPSFNQEQIDRAVEASRSKRGGKIQGPEHVVPPDPECRAVRQCRECALPFISFNVGPAHDVSRSGIGISTGVACSRCGLALCGTCVFKHLLARVNHPTYYSDSSSIYTLTDPGKTQICSHSTDAPPHAITEAMWFADAEKIRSLPECHDYVIESAEGEAVINYEKLQLAVMKTEEERCVFGAWLSSFDQTVLQRCSQCGGLSLLPISWIRGASECTCMACGARTCVRCGGSSGCDCKLARIVATGTIGRMARPYIVETIMYSMACTSVSMDDAAAAVVKSHGGDINDLVASIDKMCMSSKLIASKAACRDRIMSLSRLLRQVK